MSVITPPRAEEDEVVLAVAEQTPATPEPAGAASPAAQRQLVNVPLIGVAGLLSTAAAGWMTAGVFHGMLARAIAVLGALIGAGMITWSYRSKRPATIQWLAMPVAMLAGALLVLPFAHGGSANLPGLIVEAIRGGGIAQPPVPFDPGWRFLLLVLMAIIGAASVAIAIGTGKPKIAVVLPAPLMFGAALIQPPGATFTSSAIALVLFVASFAVSFGADLARDGATSGKFELRRFGKGAGVLVVLVAALVALSQLGFLFPKQTELQKIPPRRPETPPPAVDRVLFTVKGPAIVPLRLGVLDVYRQVAWLTPPFDPARLQTVAPSGALPYDTQPGDAPPFGPRAPKSPPDDRYTFTIKDVQGHVLPNIANAEGVDRASRFELQWDPRTQGFRLPDVRATSGMIYTVLARAQPDAAQLQAAQAPPQQMQEYLETPPAPPVVADLLAHAPTDNEFDRLQYVRNVFYRKVVAAGAGNPVDVPPHRVEQMLQGKEATPYEITAGEVLLARWAGVPARIGYGYYGGDSIGRDTWSIRPKHGATWLEAYFTGYGWIPIIGTPPRAKASLDSAQKNNDPSVRPTDELALLVYVPIQLQTIQLLYEIARYWLLHALPFIVALLLLYGFYPGALKALRRYRRRRWAGGLRAREQVAVAYAELRDTATDLNIGDVTLSPLEFVACIAADPEHRELAWLVTRALWGDLARDLRPEDVEAAEDLAGSVRKRLRRANPALNRIVSIGSRESLRNPFSDEIPNMWRRRAPRAVRRRALRPRGFRRALRRGLATTLFLGMFGLSACAQGFRAPAGARAYLPPRIVPPSIADVTFKREVKSERAFTKAGAAALVAPGRVYSIHQGPNVQGSFEAAAFKPQFLDRKKDLKEGVLNSLGGGDVQLTRLGTETVYEMRMPEQRIFLWFPPDTRYFVLMVSRLGFTQADELFAQILAYEHGGSATAPSIVLNPPVDPRRGVIP